MVRERLDGCRQLLVGIALTRVGVGVWGLVVVVGRAQNDVRLIYKKIEEGADVNFVFGGAYGCPEGYTPLMSAAHRGRLDACKALLRAVSRRRPLLPPVSLLHTAHCPTLRCSTADAPQRRWWFVVGPVGASEGGGDSRTCKACVGVCVSRSQGADPNYMNAAGDLTLFWCVTPPCPCPSPPPKNPSLMRPPYAVHCSTGRTQATASR